MAEEPPIREPVERINSDEEMKNLLSDLLDYNWSDEARDFEEMYPECGEGHIFVTMARLEQWRTGRPIDLAEYHRPVEEEEDASPEDETPGGAGVHADEMGHG